MLLTRPPREPHPAEMIATAGAARAGGGAVDAFRRPRALLALVVCASLVALAVGTRLR